MSDETAAHRASALLCAFEFQVKWCHDAAPFTSRLLRRSARWLAGDPAAHAAFAAFCPDDPLAGAIALRWAGALHHLALRGLKPWADLWPPVGLVCCADVDDEALDAALDAAISHAWQAHRAHCCAALALPPQTNEVLRSAVLLPGLLHLAAHAGLPLVLLEIGASAGLNLWCDRYRHCHGAWSWGDRAAALQLDSEWRGRVFIDADADLRIARRAGCDANPIDLSLPDEGLRLESFIWPEQRLRLDRLRVARREVARWLAESGLVVAALPAADFVDRELRAPAPGCTTVLMHSVVWQYIDAKEQRAVRQGVEAAGARATAGAPLAWLRMEPPTAESAVELRCRIWPGGEDRLLAKVHPHGLWVDWMI